jgi:hypothetical protein
MQANVRRAVAHGHLSRIAVVGHATELNAAGWNEKATAVNLISELLSVGRGGKSTWEMKFSN